jgi:hypothetical protein
MPIRQAGGRTITRLRRSVQNSTAGPAAFALPNQRAKADRFPPRRLETGPLPDAESGQARATGTGPHALPLATMPHVRRSLQRLPPIQRVRTPGLTIVLPDRPGRTGKRKYFRTAVQGQRPRATARSSNGAAEMPSAKALAGQGKRVPDVVFAVA